MIGTGLPPMILVETICAAGTSTGVMVTPPTTIGAVLGAGLSSTGSAVRPPAVIA